MIKLLNYSTNINSELIKKLEEDLNALLELNITIEVWNHPKEVHPEWKIRVMRFLYGYNLESTDGEFYSGIFSKRIILYERAFKGSRKRLLHIALHEIGHYKDKNPMNKIFHRLFHQKAEQKADEFAARYSNLPFFLQANNTGC